MNIIKLISRFILGVLFIFSGFVKALDPLGSAYKFSDYFHAFGLDFLDSLSLPLGIFLAAFELVLGLTLILGYQKKITYWVLLIFMSFFTVLTFILALTNPVSDCGCFGDAIIMTNWQTFFKNLVFMLFVMILFLSRGREKNVHSNIIERGVIAVFFTGVFVFSGYCLNHLPVIDFRPYATGTYIPAGMTIPEDAPLDEYETILYYENLETGKEEIFTIDNYPTDTLKYKFVNSESKLLKKGYEPPIHDFGIINPEGDDVTDILLEEPNYTLLMISYDLENSDKQLLQRANEWNMLQRISADFDFMPVSASTTNVKEEVITELDLEYDFYSADEIMLKTMIRSNPGFVLLKNGTILAKWSHQDFPMLKDWNDQWPEFIEQYKSEHDPELLKLVEEGYMDAMNFDMIEFDQTANQVVILKNAEKSDRQIRSIMILLVLLVICVVQFLPSNK